MDSEGYSIDFKYSFSSGIGAYEEQRYVRSHFLQIILTDGWGKEIEEVGHVKFLVIYIDQIWDSGHSVFNVLDAHSEYLARHIFQVYDTDTNDFDEKIRDHLRDLFSSNICFIKHMEILPKFRGLQIGAKAIKDIVFHYSSGCGLFMVQPFPLQFEATRGEENYPLLELDQLEKDENKAFPKLRNYYQGMGFTSVEGIDDLLFYNPAHANEAMDNINLEEYEGLDDRLQRIMNPGS